MRQYIQVAKNIYKSKKQKKDFDSTDELVHHHFSTWSQLPHQNASNLTTALRILSKKPAVILETGTSAYGVDSSRLFDSYIRNFGGSFFSIDNRKQAKRDLFLQHSRKSVFLTGDSVEVMKKMAKDVTFPLIDLLYLDSWDVDWFNPKPSADHGLREFLAIENKLHDGSVIIVDDTPRTLSWIPQEAHEIALNFKQQHGVLPGKGAFIIKLIKKRSNYRVIVHDYNIVFQPN